MNLKNHKHINHFLMKLSNKKGILFHLAGIVAIIWFIVRVLPRPDRIRYPCQQMGITIAVGYIAFWGLLWSALFYSIGLWIKKVKFKTTAIAPIILVSFILIFSITSNVFADNYIIKSNDEKLLESWEPIPNEPIGIPMGINPGRVAWVWDPDATDSNLEGFWWEEQNNNPEVIKDMFSKGLKALTDSSTDEAAWDILFKNFNEEHGNGDIGYQPGEKIAIKLNLNNVLGGIGDPYPKEDNDRDANPYVVKALLRDLVNIIGVAQKDITLFDASRPIPNWFYNRVYYETYPADLLVKEFPNIHFFDSNGGAEGREKVIPSSIQMYFSNGIIRTLPTCVVEAKYIINMPLLKRHPINMGITLSGKNFFGSFIEPVSDVHPYHQSGLIMGNPAPQVDLLAYEHLGGKTLIYIGDGTFGTKVDHKTIEKFFMYPFNNDWTNSLFFSQDPVALDSVMFDFLLTEGTNPCEGSQNYLHQAAVPSLNTYDPEHDGIYLSTSLGVHEHWNKNIDIFSNDRYIGLLKNGIDFIAIGIENAEPAVFIINPEEKYLYIYGKEIIKLRNTIIIGDIEIKANANIDSGTIEKVEFYINDDLKATFLSPPYNYFWTEKDILKFKYKIRVIAFCNGKTFNDDLNVLRIL